jgi:hypothetical protein
MTIWRNLLPPPLGKSSKLLSNRFLRSIGYYHNTRNDIPENSNRDIAEKLRNHCFNVTLLRKEQTVARGSI